MSLSFPLRTSSVMIDHVDAYVVGFSFLSFYLLKIYLEARVVWKQFGCVTSYLSRRICRAEFDSPSSSTIPGRRTLIDGFSTIGNLTREIKYITPGADKLWRGKHAGAVPLLVFRPQGILTLISGIEYKKHGWDAISGVRRS